MCRYAFHTYKPHLACFECRKTFRRKLLGDISEDAKAETLPAKCPECEGLLADMGLDFKSPQKNDLKSWKHMSELYLAGVTFHSCGCSGPGYIPKDRETLLLHLDKTKERYVKHLRDWINYLEPQSKREKELRKQKGDFLYIPFEIKDKKKKVRKEDVIAYWTERINKIENNINEIRNTK